MCHKISIPRYNKSFKVNYAKILLLNEFIYLTNWLERDLFDMPQSVLRNAKKKGSDTKLLGVKFSIYKFRS